jgi:Xaa-Pro aminopeptidase
MTFALETQHGKRFRYGVRIEEMLIVKKNEIEIVSNFPVKQITSSIRCRVTEIM